MISPFRETSLAGQAMNRPLARIRQVLSALLIGMFGGDPGRDLAAVGESELVRMCWTWFCAVRSEITRRAAMSRLLLPVATRRATSASRGDSKRGVGASRCSRVTGDIPSDRATGGKAAASAAPR